MLSQVITVQTVNGQDYVRPSGGMPEVNVGDAVVIDGVWYEVKLVTGVTIDFTQTFTGASGTYTALLIHFFSGNTIGQSAFLQAQALAKLQQKIGTEMYQFFTSANNVPVREYTREELPTLSIYPQSVISSSYPTVVELPEASAIPKSDRVGELNPSWFEVNGLTLGDLAGVAGYTGVTVQTRYEVTQAAEAAPVVLDFNINGNYFKVYANKPTLTLQIADPVVPTLSKRFAHQVDIEVIDAVGCNIQFDSQYPVHVASGFAAKFAASAKTVLTFSLIWVSPTENFPQHWEVVEAVGRCPISTVQPLTGYAKLAVELGGSVIAPTADGFYELSSLNTKDGYRFTTYLNPTHALKFSLLNPDGSPYKGTSFTGDVSAFWSDRIGPAV